MANLSKTSGQSRECIELSAKSCSFKALLASFCRDEGGSTAIEYALMATMFAIVAIGAATQLGDVVSENLFALAAAMFPGD